MHWWLCSWQLHPVLNPSCHATHTSVKVSCLVCPLSSHLHSGKTTYCNGMQQYMLATGRKACVVNLDPANDSLPYTAAVDVADLVHLDAVMEELHLGPNGGEAHLTKLSTVE